MVQTAATDVDAYLDEAPPRHRAALGRLRVLCATELTDHEEDMSYGMPTYVRDGAAEFAFADRKSYVSVYVLRGDVRAAHAEELAAYDGTSCLRFASPDAIDFDLVRRLLRATAAASAETR